MPDLPLRLRGRLAALFFVTGLVLALVGCQPAPHQWRTRNISGVMPDLQFTLVDANGRTVHADRFKGMVTLLYFGYTHCPDVCPLSLATIGQALHGLAKDRRDQVRVLFVSVDPARDSGALLRQYAQAFGPQFVGLTGSTPQLQRLSKRYRVSYRYGKKQADGAYTVYHSAGIFVFDRAGHVRLLMNRKDGADAMRDDLGTLLRED